MLRAPFFSSIISPLVAGTMTAVIAGGSFHPVNFLLVLAVGLGLHAAVNVYNDIYDFLQGTDKINVNRNQFSGGSGVLNEFPNMLGKMHQLARTALIISIFGTALLTPLVDRMLWPFLWSLVLVSALLSKYYTAAPIKLAYRGLGELFVFTAFGPMAIWLAAIGQNNAFQPLVYAAMPITGLSTLSILLIGQMIDLPADKATGKWGVAARKGNRFTAKLFTVVQSAIVGNVLLLAWMMPKGLPVLLALVPYVMLFPKMIAMLHSAFEDVEQLKKVALLNVQTHLQLSLLLSVGLGMTLAMRLLQ